MRLSRNLREARETITREMDERVRVARLKVCRDVLIAVGAVAAIVALLGATAPTSEQATLTYLQLSFPLQLYAGGLVAWISIWRRGATTAELKRAQNARLLVALPLVAPATFALFFLLNQDWVDATRAAVAATVGVAAAALVGYLRWVRSTQN